MHADIGETVVFDLVDDNVFIYDNDPREHMKYDSAYYGFEKDVDMDEDVDFTSAETEADNYDQ